MRAGDWRLEPEIQKFYGANGCFTPRIPDKYAARKRDLTSTIHRTGVRDYFKKGTVTKPHAGGGLDNKAQLQDGDVFAINIAGWKS